MTAFTNNVVNDIDVVESDVYVAGDFTKIGPFSVDGSAALDFGAALTVDRVARASNDTGFIATAVTADSVYAGTKLSAYNPQTGEITGWNPGADSSWGVWALEIGPSGLLAGRDFKTVAGIAQSHFAVFKNG